MSKKKTYELDNTSSIDEAFKLLKKKQIITAYNIVVKFYAKIKKAKEIGYSFNEISELIFKPNNILISGNEIQKNYFQITKEKKPKSKSLEITNNNQVKN
ncbi:MAG: hypothetical protein K2P99_01990 [Burkholderiales bacterium]|nr:hypothetical protein [Burkholderiales bacterium]